MIAWKTRLELSMIEDFMGEMVDVTGGFRACEDLPIFGRGIDGASDDEQAFLHRILQLSPELVGPSEQWHIGSVFVVGEADNPG
jgi:hypothetical protein